MERKKEEGELLPCWSWERLTPVTEWEMPQIRGRRGWGSGAGELVVPKGRAPPGRGRRISSPRVLEAGGGVACGPEASARRCRYAEASVDLGCV